MKLSRFGVLVLPFFASCQFLGMVEGFNCANVVEIEKSGLFNYLASVSFKTPIPLKGEQWVMEMDTDTEFTFLGVSGKLSLRILFIHFLFQEDFNRPI
jgi:hypothetical protein